MGRDGSRGAATAQNPRRPASPERVGGMQATCTWWTKYRVSTKTDRRRTRVSRFVFGRVARKPGASGLAQRQQRQTPALFSAIRHRCTCIPPRSPSRLRANTPTKLWHRGYHWAGNSPQLLRYGLAVQLRRRLCICFCPACGGHGGDGDFWRICSFVKCRWSPRFPGTLHRLCLKHCRRV